MKQTGSFLMSKTSNKYQTKVFTKIRKSYRTLKNVYEISPTILRSNISFINCHSFSEGMLLTAIALAKACFMRRKICE